MTRWPVRIVLERDDFYATLTEDAYGGAAVLWWSDGVANDWTEKYDTLAEGLMRLALLDRGCSTETDDALFFTDTPAQFMAATHKFMNEHLA